MIMSVHRPDFFHKTAIVFDEIFAEQCLLAATGIHLCMPLPAFATFHLCVGLYLQLFIDMFTCICNSSLTCLPAFATLH